MKPCPRWLVATLALCTACTGEFGDYLTDDYPDDGTGLPGHGPGGVGKGNGTGPVTVNGVSPVVEQPSWRLTNAEYTNSVRDLLGVSGALSVNLDPDSSSGGFRVGGVASDNTVRTYHDAALALADQVMGALPQLLPCATAGDAACAAKFIDSFGPRAFRRPLEETQRAALVQLYATVSAKYDFSTGIRALVEQILQSPYFLYHLELEEQALGPGAVLVSGYSMASRLSYLLWATTPDDDLLTKAGKSQLSTTEQVQTEARRMVGDPRAHAGLRNFYEQWFQILDLPVSKNGAYAATFTPDLASSMRASFDAQVDDAFWSGKDSVKALLTGRQGFVNATLAPIFGVAGIAGAQLQKVALDPKQRAGILTHPALLSLLATDTISHPIKRGVFMWDRVLCEPLPDPPPNVPPFTPPPAGVSLRQQYEHLTADATCQGCHVRINPVGFLFESYDTVGKFRTTDDVGRPVDTSVTISMSGDVDGATDSASQFADRLGGAGSPVKCMVDHLYRYAAKRNESDADGPALTSLTSSFTESGQSVPDLLVALAQSDVFLYRFNVQ